jgi:O-antigen/teichoic acid export membrane protein
VVRLLRPFALLVVNALGRLSGFVLLPFLTRKLPVDDFGDWVLSQTIYGLLPLLLALGLPAAMSQRYFAAKDRHTAEADMSALARLLLRAALWGMSACLVGGIVLGLFISRLAVIAPALALSVGGATLLLIPTTHLRLRQRTVPLALLQFSDFALSSLSILFALNAGLGLPGALAAQATASLALGGFSLAYVFARLPSPSSLSFSDVRQTSLPLVPHLVANQAQIVVDRWCLGVSASAEELSRYSIASQLSSPASMTVGAWNETESPRLGERFRTDGIGGLEQGIRENRRTYLLVAGASALALLLSLPLLTLLLGKDFRGATELLPATLLVLAIDTLYYPLVNALFLLGRTSAIPKVTVAAACLSALLNIALVPLMGAWGAVLARGVTATARAALLRRAVNQSLKEASESSKKV